MLTLDLVAGYQWVWQTKQQEQIARKRAHFWTKLGVLVFYKGCRLETYWPFVQT